MNAQHQESLASAEQSRWSACAAFFWGTLGTGAPAERRYKARSAMSAMILVGWGGIAFALHFPPKVLVTFITLLSGVVITYIAWELRRYLLALDELARRMHMEAIAWTYLTGFVLAGWIGVFIILGRNLISYQNRQTLLFMIPFLFFLLEAVRGAWLYHLSRRY